MREIEIGKTYKHFKGMIVTVIDIVFDVENYPNKMVIYEEIDTKIRWARPYDMFISEVDHKKYPDVKQKYRFEEVD